jgi:hypothetical protein
MQFTKQKIAARRAATPAPRENNEAEKFKSVPRSRTRLPQRRDRWHNGAVDAGGSATLLQRHAM